MAYSERCMFPSYCIVQFNCLLPPDPPADVVMTHIVEWSVISYQCGEVETLVLCGDDGNWRPHPTTITCDITTSESSTNGASTGNSFTLLSNATDSIIVLPVIIGGCVLGAIMVVAVVFLIALLLVQASKKKPARGMSFHNAWTHEPGRWGGEGRGAAG